MTQRHGPPPESAPPMTGIPPARAGRFYPLVDARCTHFRCNEPNVYRMVGHCENCNLNPVLILVTAGHDSPRAAKCPKCGCYRVRATRLAEDDELPKDTP